MRALVNEAMLSAYLDNMGTMEAWKSGSEKVAKESCELEKGCVCWQKKHSSLHAKKTNIHEVCIYTKYVFNPAFILHSIFRAIHAKNLQARICLHSIPLNMQGVQFLKKITSPKNVINSRTHGAHAGGRGCACAPAFFLYYYHPPHNFFRNMPPLMGLRFAHGYDGVKAHLFDAPNYPHAPHTAWPRFEAYGRLVDREYDLIYL